jgi:hypothetical protein
MNDKGKLVFAIVLIVLCWAQAFLGTFAPQGTNLFVTITRIATLGILVAWIYRERRLHVS